MVMEKQSKHQKIWKDKSKDVNGYEQKNRDSLQSSHDPSVYSSKPSC